MEWREKARGVFYALGVHGRCDRDIFGNEWICGFSVHCIDKGTYCDWNLLDDDGRGNGDWLATFDTLADAQAHAAHLDAHPWVTGTEWTV